MHIFRKILIGLCTAGLAVFLAVLVCVCVFAGRTYPAQEADCVIVLGARVRPSGVPSDTLRYRLETALDAWRKGLAPNIIVTGGRGADEPATEASVMRQWLIDRGVPQENVFAEDRATDTRQNFAFSKEIMEENGYETALVVTSHYHLTRALWIAEEAGLEAYGLPAHSPTKVTTLVVNRLRETASWIVYGINRLGIPLFR